jgi:Zn-dependent protease
LPIRVVLRSVDIIRPTVPLLISRSALAPIVAFAALFTILAVEVGLPLVTSAIFGGLGGAVSLLFHELGHVRAASSVKSVRPVAVSFIWAGAATTLEGRYRTGRDQARVAIGGPQASFTFALTLMAVSFVLPMSTQVRDLLLLLAFLNIALGLLNLVPAYPLDGYKVAAGLLWAATGSEREARQILRRIGIGWAALEGSAALLLLVEKPPVGGLALMVGSALLMQKRLMAARAS